MYFMSDPQALHVTRNVIPGKLGVDLHLHRVHIPLVVHTISWHKSTKQIMQHTVIRIKYTPKNWILGDIGWLTVVTRKKSQNRNISPICGSPRWTDWNENLHWCRTRGHNHGRQVQIWKLLRILMSRWSKFALPHWLCMHVDLTTVQR